MFQLLTKLLALCIIIAGVILLSIYSDTIRMTIANQFGMYQGQVAGAKTSLEDELKKNVTESATDVQKKVLQLNVEDVVNSFATLKKIGQDINELKNQITEAIDEIGKK